MLNTHHSSLSPKHQWQSFPYHQYHHNSAINLRAPFSGLLASSTPLLATSPCPSSVIDHKLSEGAIYLDAIVTTANDINHASDRPFRGKPRHLDVSTHIWYLLCRYNNLYRVVT